MAWTHQQLRRELGYALGDLGVYPASANDATSFASLLLKNATAGAAVSRLNGKWAYVANGLTARQVRRIRTNGYTPSTGAVLIYPDWAAPVPGAEVEVTSLFPAILEPGVTTGERTSYQTIINGALDRMPIRDQVLVATVAGAYAYGLGAYAAWLTSEDRLLRVGGPPIVAGYPSRDDGWRVDRLDIDNGVPTLRLRAPYAANNETIRLDVVRPADTLVSGAESAVGLVGEVDSVSSQVRLDEFLTVALADVYAVLANVGHDGADWAGMAEKQEAAARGVIARMARRARGQPDEAPQQPATGAAA